MRRCLLIVVQSEVIDNEETKGIREKLDDTLETAMRIMNRLFTKYIKDKYDKNADKPSGEIEQMEIEYT